MDNEQMMIDFSAYIQSDWAWIVLFVMAIFVGMSKTGVQGLAILTVLFFFNFETVCCLYTVFTLES